MPTVGPFQMIDHRFEVVCSDPAITEQLDGVLVSMQAPGLESDHRYEVTPVEGTDRYDVVLGGRLIRGRVDAEDVVDAVCTEANRLAVESSVAPAVLHAGAVERGGRAVVIAGISGAGKTTLVTRLLGRGWRYLTDEAVQLTEDLHVLPYLKPLVRKEGQSGEELLTRAHIPPHTLGGLCHDPVPLAGLVLLGAEAHTPGERLVAACTLAFPVGPSRDCLELLAQVVRHHPVVVVQARPPDLVADDAVQAAFEGLAAGSR